MVLLVTGKTGAISPRLVKALLSEGYRVAVTTNDTASLQKVIGQPPSNQFCQLTSI